MANREPARGWPPLQGLHRFPSLILYEITLMTLIWLVSLWISHPTFNRPLDLGHDWLMAHTLISLRAFEDWGFWKVMGAALLTPHTFELQDLDITTLDRQEGIYLSYPTLFVIIPYLVFKLLNSFHLVASLSVAYLESYHLLINRLGCGIVIYYLLLEAIQLITPDSVPSLAKRGIALFGFINWILCPPILYWTQNIYFTDQAILLPVYGMFWLVLKHRFQFNQFKTYETILLFIAAFCACGIDWYGWVACVMILITTFVQDLKSILQSANRFQSLWTAGVTHLKATFPIYLGMILAGISFVVQLIYYKVGFTYVSHVAVSRSLLNTTSDSGESINLLTLGQTIYDHTLPYLSQGSLRFVQNPLLCLVLIIVNLILIHMMSTRKSSFIYIGILFFLIPVVQIISLSQHSFIHNFSAFKLGLPLIFVTHVLPLVLLTYAWTQPSRLLKSCSVIVLLLTIFTTVTSLSNSRTNFMEFTDFDGTGTTFHQDIGSIVSTYVGSQDLPLSTNLARKSIPPMTLWYTNRFIYDLEQLKSLQNLVGSQKLKQMQPVYFDFRVPQHWEDRPDQRIGSICRSQWILPSDPTIVDRPVIVCRSPRLKTLVQEILAKES